MRADESVGHHGSSQAPDPPDVDYDRFFVQTLPLLLKVGLAMGASLAIAEESANDSMADLYRRWSEVDKPREYACQVMKNRIIKALSREREQVRRMVAGGHVTPAACDDATLNEWEDREYVVGLLDRLPAQQRAVMACVIDLMTPDEIALALGKTKPTIRKHLQLARIRLKQELAKSRQPERDPSVRKEHQ